MRDAMGYASAITAGFALVALCTATFNFWLFAKRPKERTHLWLAVAALGIVGLSGSSAALYESQNVGLSAAIQLTSLNASLPLVVGILRFTHHFLRIDIHRYETVTYLFAGTMVLTMNLWPELMLTLVPRVREVAFFGQTYVESELATPALYFLAVYMGLLGMLIPIYATKLHRIDVNGRSVFGALCIWFLCGLNDVAVAADLYRGTYLIGFGYAVFVVVFTAILVGRFVESMERVEADADTLQQLVHARTEELREKDLALAHGDRMATLGTLAAGVAHEINNPIAFISANLNQLADAWKRGDAEPVEEILTETREGVDRIRAIVQELLSLARRGEGVDEPVDLCQVVRSVLPILRHEAHAHAHAQIETLLQPVPSVRGDERLLGQVVLNLALNALHAMAESASVRPRLTISTAYEDDSAWLVVRDTGGGIPDDVLPHVFDPFFTTKQQGTGLGLAVSHQIVTRHRGRIGVETGPGGTAITVELPPAESTDPVRRDAADGLLTGS